MKSCSNLSIFIVVFIAILTSCFCQNETGSRTINKDKWQSMKFWYDSSTAMFQVKYPIIRSIPPLSIGMNTETFFSYIYLDSLLRFTNDATLNSKIKSWTSVNDTLRQAVRYLYRIVDYNPIIFNQYSDEVSLYYKYPEYAITRKFGDTSAIVLPTKISKYTAHLSSLCELLYGKMGRLIYDDATEFNKKSARAVASLLRADYILKIKVLQIDSTPNKNSPFDYKRYRVIGLVEDTLKGKIFQTLCGVPSISNQNSIATSLPCNKISFQYTPHNYRGFGEYSSNSNPNVELLRDSAFTDDNGYYKMSLDQEAIVFLKHHNRKLYFEYDYYDLDVEPSCSYNALFINSNGQIRDNNHFWSDNDWISYSNWKEVYTQLVNTILLGKF